MPRVPGDVPQVPFQPTQMPGYQAPVVQPSQNFMPQQLQQLAGGLQDVGQASSRIGSSMQRQDLAEQEAKARQQDALNDSITNEKLIQYRVEAGQYARDFFKQEGVAARDGFQKYMEGFDEINKKYDEYFQDPILKNLWQNKSTLYREEWRYDMATHAQEQAKIVDKSNLVGSKDLSRQDYARSVGRKMQPPSPDMFGNVANFIAPEAHKAVIVDAVKKLNSDKDEAFIKSKITEELESLHKETIGGMLGVVQPKLIMSYLEENKGEISPEFYASAKADLQRTDRVSNAKAEALDIYSRLPSTEIGGVKVVDEDTVVAAINKSREERAKRIQNNEDVDEQYYSTRDSYMLEMANRDGRVITSAKNNIRNGWEQAFFEMSNSEFEAYDPTLSHGNALEKLREKFPKLYADARNVGALGDILDYARKTEFGAKSDISVLEAAKAYVAQTGKTADAGMFVKQFGNGLSTDDKRRLLTDISINQGKADQKTIDHQQSIRAIDRTLEEMGLTVAGKFNGDNQFGLTKDQFALVEFKLKNEWDAISFKGFAPGVNEAKAFENWIQEKKSELTTNRGKTLDMAQGDRAALKQPYYYSFKGGTYNLDSVDEKNIKLAASEIESKNKNRFYYTYVDEAGVERPSKGFANQQDRDAHMRMYQAENKQRSNFVSKEYTFRPIISNDIELRKLAVEIARGRGEDPDLGNRINAIITYQDRYAGLKETQKIKDLNAMRKSIIDGSFDPNKVVYKETALMLTGLNESDFAVHNVKSTVPSNTWKFYSGIEMENYGETSTEVYKLSDLAPAFTPSFMRAIVEKKLYD